MYILEELVLLKGAVIIRITKRAFTIIIALLLISLPLCLSAHADEVVPFRINVSRISMGDSSEANTGCYFVLNGQEQLLVNNSYSRAILAVWDKAQGCYIITGSLGYANMKTEWDIPADGFALMISAFSESNEFDSVNFHSLGDNFSYSNQTRTDYLAGQKIYLYNIDLKNETVVTEGIENTNSFASSSYVTIGAPDVDAEVEPYSGEGVLIDKSQDVPESVDIYSKMYLSGFSAYYSGDEQSDNVYGQCFLIMPDDENAAAELSRINWAYACVIEENGGEYRVVHTAQWVDKSDWLDLWLTDDNGNVYSNRFILVCHIMNDEEKYPGIYNFEMQNWRTAYYKLDPSPDWGGNGEEGSAYGMQVFFYNVDFKNRTIMTSGVWGDKDFTSDSYVTFGAKDYSGESTTLTSATPQSTTVVTEKSDTPIIDSETIIALASGLTALIVLVVLIAVKVIRRRRQSGENDILG